MFIYRILEKLICLLGAFIVLQLPQTTFQYEQLLEGHVKELNIQVDLLNQFARMGNKSLDDYIQKFLSNTDPDFARQGEFMKKLVQRWHTLTVRLQDLKKASAYTKPILFITIADEQISKEVWQLFTWGVPVNSMGFIYGFAGFLFTWLLIFIIKYSSRQISKLRNPSPPKVDETNLQTRKD